MDEIIGRFIDFNQYNVNYDALITICTSYFFLLWLVISAWVGMDAWKRFNNRNIAVTFFILTFLLNFPVLIFYFIVRPEFKYDDIDDWEAGGVHVPIVNFVGKEGIEMSLELKINPARVSPGAKDMKIDVSWDSQKAEMDLMTKNEKLEEVTEKYELVTPEEHKQGDEEVTKISNRFTTWGGLVKKKIANFKSRSGSYFTRRSKKNEKASPFAQASNEEDRNSKKKLKKRNRKKKRR